MTSLWDQIPLIPTNEDPLDYAAAAQLADQVAAELVSLFARFPRGSDEEALVAGTTFLVWRLAAGLKSAADQQAGNRS
jgi:hypothetical protein